MRYQVSVSPSPVAIIILLFAVSPAWAQAVTSATHGLTYTSSSAVLHPDTTDTLQWSPPRFTERRKERLEMVSNSLEGRISNEAVLSAMRRVPRHLFVPQQYRTYAYRNQPLPIGHEQTISQPYIVAFMTELLNLQPGDKVLEIGTGSGYQAAVLSELTSEVYTIEIVEPLAKQARRLFDDLGYRTIRTKTGDGYQGWNKHAPFDAIILTAAPPKIPQPLIDQLKAGGVLVAPVGIDGASQILVKVTKQSDGSVTRQQVLPVRFVPMTGKARQ